MREITKTYTVYSYGELDKAAQEKVREDAYTWLAEDRCNILEDILLENLVDVYGIDVDWSGDRNSDDKLYYSLSYSQGDGVCFTKRNLLSYTRLKEYLDGTAAISSLNAFEKLIVTELEIDERKAIMTYLNYGYNINIKKISWNYEHSHTCDFEWDYFCNDGDRKEEEYVNDVINDLCSHSGKFRDVYDDICNGIERVGYDLIDPSEEEVEEFIDANEYEFLADGTLFNE